MYAISDFPITKRWPAQYPDRLRIYSIPTPNGLKVSIMLEEIGLNMIRTAIISVIASFVLLGIWTANLVSYHPATDLDPLAPLSVD
jgi:hypothetical protein